MTLPDDTEPSAEAIAAARETLIQMGYTRGPLADELIKIFALALDRFRAAEREWRPIESAPCEGNWREGPYFLLANRHHAGVGKWYQDDYGETGWVDEHLEPIEPPPTHWMPLPEPPHDR